MPAETIAMPDGDRMEAHVELPEGGEGPGVLVLMEIFGVGPYIRRATERLAALGYVALAPDLYRRIEPGLELEHDDAGVAEGMRLVRDLDPAGAVEDASTALGELQDRPEVSGRVAVLGFCLGGTLAFQLAATADPDAAVCYYGSGVAGALEQADAIACPVLFHYGAEDQFIAREDIERVRAAAARRPDWECHVHDDAGHAFDNHEAPAFHEPEAAAAAWESTRRFLAREIG